MKLIVDLPEECAFVDNSVMRGAQTATYTYADNQVVVPLDYYGERVRFCFIPTTGGDFTATGSVQFTLSGKTITQPIGNVHFMVKDLSISVPSTIAKTTMPISGAAPGKSSVEIYDDGMLIGNTTALANGTWEATCELNNPYNLSTHNIYAKVTTKAGMELVSETKQMVYDMNMIVPEKVTMLYYNPEFVGQYNIVFDLINGTVDPTFYYFFPYKNWPNWWETYETEPKDFTFVADLSNNDTTVVSGVTIRVYTDKGNWRNLEAKYDSSMGKWVAISQFTSSELPEGVDVDIHADSEPQIDRSYFDEIFDELSNSQNDINNNLEVIDSIANALNDENASDEEWLTAYEHISNLLGINVDVEEEDLEITDEYIQTLIDECESIIAEAWSIDGYLNESIYGNLSGFSDEYKDIITVLTCDDLIESELDPNEYLEFKLTDGSSIYVKTSENTFELIDFQKNIHYVMHANEGTELARSLKRAGALDRITSAMTAIKDFGDKISGLMRLITTSLDTALETTLAWKEAASREHVQIFQALTQMGRDAKETGKVNEIMRTKLRWQLKSLKSTIAAMESCEKLLKKINKSILGLNILVNIANAYNDLNGFVTLYNHPKLNHCPDNEEGVQKIRNLIIAVGIIDAEFYVANIGLDFVSLETIPAGIAGAAISAGATLAAVLVAITKLAASSALEKARSNFVKQYQNSIGDDILRLKCKDEDKCPRCGKNPCECKDKCPRCGNRPCTCPDKCTRCGRYPCVCPPPYPRTKHIDDPSGFVYEGVMSNRVQGVTASIYYKETVEDMYGDLHENVVLWNAEEYAQENPLFTDEYGMYRWDVPQGLWQVKFEKEGYQTTYSEWLPVPPPQLEVNIPMTQMLQPSVKSGLADSKGVEVTFDKYMDPETLTTDNIIVTKNGEKITDGTIELLDEEVAYEGQTETFASKVRFNVPEGDDNLLLSTDEVMLTVKKAVKSYAGVQMQDDYTQKFDVEPRVASIAVDELFNIGYGGERTITVAALPADASKGKKMKVQSLSTMIASVSSEELTLDENGQAELTISGELPGSTVINFKVEDTDVEGQTTINVKDAALLTTIAPRASRVSGTEVYRGTVIRLTSETENADIYYTLDGSCPCNLETALKYNPDEPIVINDDNVTIKAMAQGKDLAESEVTEFSYRLKKTTQGYQMPVGWTWISHNLENAIPVGRFSDNADRILSQRSEIIKDPVVGLVGNLTELLPTESYKVKVNTQTEKRLEGYEWNATAQDVKVEPGWNWIGYPVNQAMTVNEALAFYGAAEGDRVVGQDGHSEFVNGEWKGSLEGMVPGKGYLYKSSVTGEIPFNTTIVSVAGSRIGKRNLLRNSPWAPATNAYPNVMPLTAELYDESGKVENSARVVAAFSDTECRGVGLWMDGKVLMNIYGQGDEEIRFVVKDDESDSCYDINECLTFASDSQGSWTVPYRLTIGNETTSISVAENVLTVSPTVFSDYFSVSADDRQIAYLTLTNMSGQQVLSLSGMGSGATVTTSQLPEGMYILTVKTEGETLYKKIIKANR